VQSAIVDELLKVNQSYSERFVREKAMREEYRRAHASEIGWLGCMDGRMNGPMLCGMPIGVSQTWQNGGCDFSLDQQSFQRSLWDWYTCVVDQGRVCLILVFYHFSGSQKHLGCRAHQYDAHAARLVAWPLVEQLNDDFREHDGSRRLYAIPCGLETDREAFIFHRLRDSEVLNVATMLCLKEDEVRERFRDFYRNEIPDGAVIEDILEVALGNIAHVKVNGTIHRPTGSADHCESIIAFGRGFEWLFETSINKALVLGNFDPNAKEKIKIAAEILLNNLSERKTICRKRGVALVVSVPFRGLIEDPAGKLAQRRARNSADMAMRVITEEVPMLLPYLQFVVGIIDNDTRRLSIIRRG
jgi:hypothetical protein